MSVLVNDLRVQLQKKILSASSIREIEQGIEQALANLAREVGGNQVIGQFIDLMINDLTQSGDNDKPKQQVSNIRSARIHLNELKFYRKFEAL
jgi:hypothetical protein